MYGMLNGERTERFARYRNTIAFLLRIQASRCISRPRHDLDRPGRRGVKRPEVSLVSDQQHSNSVVRRLIGFEQTTINDATSSHLDS